MRDFVRAKIRGKILKNKYATGGIINGIHSTPDENEGVQAAADAVADSHIGADAFSQALGIAHPGTADDCSKCTGVSASIRSPLASGYPPPRSFPYAMGGWPGGWPASLPQGWLMNQINPQPLNACSKCNMPLPDYIYGQEPECNHCNPEVVTDYLVGFRSWRAGKQHLLPMNGGVNFAMEENPWKPGENHAICTSVMRDYSHYVPTPSCSCGFYIWFQPTWLAHARDNTKTYMQSPNEVFGAVKASGTIVECEDEGCRAQNAEVLALLDINEEAERMADLYGVPLLGHRDLIRYVREFGICRFGGKQ